MTWFSAILKLILRELAADKDVWVFYRTVRYLRFKNRKKPVSLAFPGPKYPPPNRASLNEVHSELAFKTQIFSYSEDVARLILRHLRGLDINEYEGWVATSSWIKDDDDAYVEITLIPPGASGVEVLIEWPVDFGTIQNIKLMYSQAIVSKLEKQKRKKIASL